MDKGRDTADMDADIIVRSSPIRETLGIRYLIMKPGRVTAQFTPGPEFANANGTIQGGILCAFLDHMMGQGAYSLVGSEDRLTTLEMSVRFVEAVLPGRLRGEGWVVRKGNSVVFTEGHILNPEGEAAAKASASLLLSQRS